MFESRIEFRPLGLFNILCLPSPSKLNCMSVPSLSCISCTWRIVNFATRLAIGTFAATKRDLKVQNRSQVTSTCTCAHTRIFDANRAQYTVAALFLATWFTCRTIAYVCWNFTCIFLLDTLRFLCKTLDVQTRSLISILSALNRVQQYASPRPSKTTRLNSRKHLLQLIVSRKAASPQLHN